ncbi:MAG TPA: anti-sigma factor [Candidatus Acidoferrales bacterium]|nr:anti-sigma factor [Candidatus Acidoferrales bacterium]
MVCDDNARLLHAYLDGELDLLRSLELEEHLKTCSGCAQELLSQQTLRKALRSANLYQHAPASLAARIRNAVSSQEGMPSAAGHAGVVPMRRYLRRPIFEWLAVAAAMVIAFLLGARLIPGMLSHRQDDLLAQEIVASHIRSLQPGHLMDVESTDQHTVKPWFNGKLDFSPPVRDFADHGFALIGGRLDYLGQRNVAVLIYQRRKHLINVFIWPEGAKAGKLRELSSSQGYYILLGSRDGMNLCAVSDVNTDDLKEIMRLMEQ